MERMGALDASFLYMETPAAHQHTLKIAISDFSSAPDGYSFARVKQSLLETLHRLPPYERRMLPVPLGLHHPVWVRDPDFDVDYHVRRMAVPAPGGTRELCEIISEIASRSLDRSKPLWELWMIEGLEGGRVAGVAKVHHAVADGMSSVELLENYYSRAPSPEPPVPPASTSAEAEPLPSRLSVLAAALKDIVGLIALRLPSLLRAAWRARKRRMELEEAATSRLKVPRTSFNRPLTPHRSFSYFSIPLVDVKQVRAAYGVTINDVVLASVAGALRRELSSRDELPEQPLIGGMPAATRAEQERGTWGNRFTSLSVALPTNIGDPVERLRAAHEASARAKRELQISRGAFQEDWLDLFPPFLVKLIGRAMGGVARAGAPPVYSVSVSNVPGPRERLFNNASPVVNFFSVGPVVEGVGLNVTVWSYVDQLNFALLACREAVPDLWAVADALRDSVDELVGRTAEERPRSA